MSLALTQQLPCLKPLASKRVWARPSLPSKSLLARKRSSFAGSWPSPPQTSMSDSWGYHDWDRGSHWRGHETEWWGHQWSGKEQGARSDQWWDPSGPADRKTGSGKLRRLNTDEGKDYSNRIYLGGEERASLTREDRLKLAWAVIYSLEPEVEKMWKPGWIQRADLQVATGTQLDALIFLTSKFQPSTNLRSFKDLLPVTVRQAVREAYVSRQPQLQARIALLEEISRHRDHLDVLVKWAEYNYFQPGADPKLSAPTIIKARAPRSPNPSCAESRLGWLYLLPDALIWGYELGQADTPAPGAQQLLALTAPGPMESKHALERGATDEDPSQPSKVAMR